MSSTMTAISDDIAEYKRLCELFNEPVQYKRNYYGILGVDCYGEHAEKLSKRQYKGAMLKWININ